MSSSTTYSEISESSSSVDPDDAGNDDYTNLDSDGSDDNNDNNDNDNGSGSGSIEPDAGAGSKSALATADAALATAQIQVSDGDSDVVDADAGGDVYIELLPAPTSSVESDADDADGDGAGHDVYIEVLPASTTASTKAPTKASKPLALAPQKLESSTLSSEKEGKVFNEDYLKARQLLIEIQTSEIIINQIISKFFVKESRETYSEHYLELLKSYEKLLYNPEFINDDLIKLLEEYREKQNEVLFPYLGSSQFKTSNNILPPAYNRHHLNNINKKNESPPPYSETIYNLVGDANGDVEV